MGGYYTPPPGGGPGAGLLQTTTVNLTQADILALADTPFVTVPAPGVGNVIFPILMRWKLTWVSRVYSESNNGGPYVWWGDRNNAFGNIANVLFAPGSGAQGQTVAQPSLINYGSVTPQNPAGYTNTPLTLQLLSPTDTLNRGPIQTAAVNDPGSGYAPGDQVSPNYAGGGGAGSNAGVLTVSSVDGGGGVTGLTITDPGGTSPGANDQPTASITGSGTGLTVDLTVLPGDGLLTVTTWYVVAPA